MSSKIQTFDFSTRMNEDRLFQFATMLRDLNRQIGFRVSSRGWCYILEQNGAINKDQFSRVEAWVNACRRQGLLPIDFVADESARAFDGVETPAESTPVQDMEKWIDAAIATGQLYSVDWWKTEEVYIQMVVEKIDLVTLFQPICKKYHIPIANSKGWSSMLQRAEYARRFKEAEERGLRCVLLYCGDHDPAGLMISDFLRKNLQDLSDIEWSDSTEGYDSCNLVIDRFGLNYDFIEENGFTWIDNLITGGGKDLSDQQHKHHHMEYVQDYLRMYGARKCEANVLVTQPDIAREMCEKTIVGYIGGSRERFKRRRQDVIDYIDAFDEKTGILQSLHNVKDAIDEESYIMFGNEWEG